MSNQGGQLKNPRLLQHFDRGNSPLLQAGLGLPHFFGGMNMNPQTQAPGMPDSSPQKIVIAGIGRMGRQPGGNPAIGLAMPALGKGSGFIQGGITSVAKDGPAQGSSGSGFFNGLGSLVHKEVMVGDRGNTPLDHFDQAQEH